LFEAYGLAVKKIDSGKYLHGNGPRG